MRTFWAALGYVGIVGLLWFGSPAIYTHVGVSIGYGTSVWCDRPGALRIWEPLPRSVLYELEVARGVQPDPGLSPIEIPVQRAREAPARLAEIRRTWLALTVWQAVMMALLLARHRPLARHGRRLASQLRRHGSPTMALLMFAVASLACLAVLTAMGPQLSGCQLTLASGIDGPGRVATPDALPQVAALARRWGFEISVQPHYGFYLISRSALILTGLLLLVSCLPHPSASVDAVAS